MTLIRLIGGPASGEVIQRPSSLMYSVPIMDDWGYHEALYRISGDVANWVETRQLVSHAEKLQRDLAYIFRDL